MTKALTGSSADILSAAHTLVSPTSQSCPTALEFSPQKKHFLAGAMLGCQLQLRECLDACVGEYKRHSMHSQSKSFHLLLAAEHLVLGKRTIVLWRDLSIRLSD